MSDQPPSSRYRGVSELPVRRRLLRAAGQGPHPGNPPLAPVLSTVIRPLELNLFIREQFAVVLHTSDVREVCETDSPSVWSSDGAPALIAMPESDAADSHGRERTTLVTELYVPDLLAAATAGTSSNDTGVRYRSRAAPTARRGARKLTVR